MVRVMYGVKLVDRKCTMELLNLLGLSPVEGVARACAVWWYGHVLGREEGSVLRKALDFEVEGCRKKGRPKSTSKRKIEVRKIGMVKEDAYDRSKWREIVRGIAEGSIVVNPATSTRGPNRIKTGDR